MSAGSALEAILRRDRAVIATALVLLAATAWAYVFWLASAMEMSGGSSMSMPSGATPAMDMPGMAMGRMEMPAMAAEAGAVLAPSLAPWSVGYAVFMVIMWSVMMVGMMTPSAAPMILLYARVGRQAAAQGKPFASTAWFTAGYLATWIGFSVVATAAQWALERAALLTPMMASASPVFGGLVLIAAGLYQCLPVKDKCLSHCQSPLLFIQRHGGFRAQAGGAFLLGLKHGAYCVGCCWSLMALLFVGGVMNVLWIAAIAIFVFAEKVVPAGRMLSRLAGAGAIVAGLFLLFHPL